MEQSKREQKVNSDFCIRGAWGPEHCNPRPWGRASRHRSSASCAAGVASCPPRDRGREDLACPSLGSAGSAWHLLPLLIAVLGAPSQSGFRSHRGSAAPKRKGQLLPPPQVILMDRQPSASHRASAPLGGTEIIHGLDSCSRAVAVTQFPFL